MAETEAPSAAGPEEGEQALQEGLRSFRAGRYADARADFLRALESDEDDIDAHRGAGHSYLALQDDLAAAAHHFERVTQLDPTATDAFFAWAQTLVLQGRMEQALWRFDQADQADGSSVEPLLAAGRLLLSEADKPDGLHGARALGEAENRFERATNRDSQSAAAWYELGNAQRERADLENARTSFATAAQIDETSVDARLRLGQILMQLERAEPAVEALEGAVRLSSRQGSPGIEARLYLALALRMGRKFGEAIPHLDHVLEEAERNDPRTEQQPAPTADSNGQPAGSGEFVQYVRWVKASVLSDAKHYKEALRVLGSAESPESWVTPLVLQNRAALLTRTGEHAAAWQTLSRVDDVLERVKPDEPTATLLRADLLHAKGKSDVARDLLEEQLRARPEDLDLLAASMRLAVDQRDHDRANHSEWEWTLWRIFEQATSVLTRQVDRPSAVLALGWWHILVGEEEQAKPLLKIVAEQDLNSSVGRAYLGMAYARTDDHEEAVSWLRAALRRDPDNLEITLALAQSYAQLGAFDQAENAYREVLASATGSIEARVGLAAVLSARADALSKAGNSKKRSDGEVASYQEAEQHLSDALQLGVTMDLDLDARRGSTSLSPSQLAALHYSLGHTRVRQYESQAGGPISFGSRRLLRQAEAAFATATELDPSHVRASRAKQRVEQNREALVRGRAPMALGIAIGLLLILLMSCFFFQWPTEAKGLNGAAYSALTLGLFVLLIALASLPDVSKISIAGGSLEKSTTQFEDPLEFGIEQDPDLLNLLRLDHGVPDMPFDRDGGKGAHRRSEAGKQAAAGARDSGEGRRAGDLVVDDIGDLDGP